MFYSDRIKSIKPSDKVLEIGPGGSPHPRSDVFLDLDPKFFKDEKEALSQRGSEPSLKTKKPVVHYDGVTFPFEDGEFDYIICSHVLEHVNDVDVFLAELFRVGNAGYIEYPTIFYDYLYNFSVHLQLLHFDTKSKVLLHMPKNKSKLNDFSEVQGAFLETLSKGHSQLIDALKDYMFEGFEWSNPFKTKSVLSVNDITPRVLMNKIPLNTPPSPEVVTKVEEIKLDFDDYGIKRLMKELFVKIKRKIKIV